MQDDGCQQRGLVRAVLALHLFAKLAEVLANFAMKAVPAIITIAVIAVAMRISMSVKPFSLFTRRMALAP